MLRSYFPIYKIGLELQELRTDSKILKTPSAFTPGKVGDGHAERFRVLLQTVIQECADHDLDYTAELAKRISARPQPETYADLFSELNHLNDSLSHQLETEAVFRVSPALKGYFEQDELFGPKVAAAFPSCERDIRKAGSCYALGQEDACVHHLMLVLERGLNALAATVGVPYQRSNWQNIIDQIASKLKSTPKGTERDFYVEVNAQFGFLKDAYRNHSEHARDDHYDMSKALSILNHVLGFMQALEKGGLSE
jgi:hypothetical protein